MSVARWTTRLPKLALFLFLLLPAFSPRVHAVPITYTMIIEHASGQLGSLTIDPLNHYLRFTFQGDTQEVASWAFVATYLTSGYQIRSGSASVEVIDHTSGTVLARATFAPEDGIFVSVDNLNQGIGFGSFGVANPSATSFGQPIYPYAITGAPNFPAPGPLRTYDLKSDFQLCQPQGLTCTSVNGQGYVALSCVDNTEIPCGAPIALVMTSGSTLLVNQYGPCGVAPHPCPTGYFEAVTHAAVEFSVFNAALRLNEESADSFSLQGRFTLGASSNGINPPKSVVTLQLNSYTVTLPVGSFTSEQEGYSFEGVVNGLSLKMQIRSLSARHYSFHAAGHGTSFVGIAPPVTVGLTIGDDSGTTTAHITPDD